MALLMEAMELALFVGDRWVWFPGTFVHWGRVGSQSLEVLYHFVEPLHIRNHIMRRLNYR
jgi:hypothetical protein